MQELGGVEAPLRPPVGSLRGEVVDKRKQAPAASRLDFTAQVDSVEAGEVRLDRIPVFLKVYAEAGDSPVESP